MKLIFQRPRLVLALCAGLIVSLGIAGVLIGVNYRNLFRSGHRASAEVPEAAEAEVHRFCGDCHAYPPPDSFPRDAWSKEVDQGFQFARLAGMNRNLPDPDGVKKYYQSRAPIELKSVAQTPLSTSPPIRFECSAFPFPRNERRPVITSIAHMKQQTDSDAWIVCDARTRRAAMLHVTDAKPVWEKLADLPFPARATVVDLDRDGILDIVISNLGVFYPSDERNGSAVLLRGRRDGKFDRHALLENVGRVADVKPIDYDGDGRMDLVVAEFGWRAAGGVLLLKNRTTNPSDPVFEFEAIDRRHGATEIAVADLNGDARPDFVCLFSQEHETVDAFLNDGAGGFRKETIYGAPHPAYGSNSLELVDLDNDGDLDLLVANGDVLDPPYLLKPYHGIQWLENKGSYPFVAHAIDSLYGVSSARSADFDGDGDVDIAAVSYLPQAGFPRRASERITSVVIYEQTKPGSFQKHVLETGSCDYLCLSITRLQNDSLPSLIVGHGDFINETRAMDAVTIWRNRGKPQTSRPD